MIASLRGIVEQSGEDGAVIDVSGVGYLVFCSGRTLDTLAVGETVGLLIETHVREDAIQLFGFRERAERDWFRLLTTVQGVGARVALAILSVLVPDDLTAAIASGDRAALTRAAGVGPRLASRILSELKDKIGGFAPGETGNGTVPGTPAGPSSEAVSALVNLGYSATDAWRAVSEAVRREGADAGVEALIRTGLTVLASKDHRL